VTETYKQVRTVLLQYGSTITVDSMLAIACRRLGATPESLSEGDLDALLQELSPGIRLFCAPERVPHMMLDLASIAD